MSSSKDVLVDWFFRIWSPVYDLPLFQRPFFRRVHRHVIDSISTNPMRLVDLGCGTAQLTHDLKRQFPTAFTLGIDLSDPMLRAAQKRRGVGAPALLRANAYTLPLANASIELLVSTISFHWYLEPERALGEIHRVLRPGGQLILATVVARRISGVVGLIRWSTERDIETMLTAAGFSLAAKRRVFPGVRVFVASA